MMFPWLANFADLALLFQRLMVAVIFGDSGWRNLKDPAGRSKDIGMSKGFTLFLGVIELAGAIGEAAGVLTQLAAAGLILVSLGAIYVRVFAWHTGFWGKNGGGWSYDLMMIVMNLVILTTGGGRYLMLY